MQLLCCSVGGYLRSVITHLRLGSGDEGVGIQLFRTVFVFIRITGHLKRSRGSNLISRDVKVGMHSHRYVSL